MQQYCPSRRDGETRLIVSGTGGVEVAAFLSTFAFAASVRAKASHPSANPDEAAEAAAFWFTGAGTLRCVAAFAFAASSC